MIISAKFFAAKRSGRWLLVLTLMTLGIAGAYWYWSTPRLNVILVTFDTTRADRLGTYGYEKGLTGGFDDFARQGVVFDRAYAPAPLTLPSHATMLTGLYPPEHGLRVNGAGQLDRSLPLLSEILHERGYETGAFIAAAVLDSKYGLDRGFDTYDDELPRKKSGQRISEPRRDGQDIITSAISWLQQRTARPFFCWIHLYDAHGPYDARPDIFGEQFADAPYDAGVAWQVRQFERLTAFLKERGIDRHTLVIVAGDHGEGLDDHGESEHGMLIYNTTLHVPFVFAGPPEFRPGTHIREAVSLVDLAPTVLEILRIPPPPHCSGRSLLAAIRGGTLPARDCYAETHTPFVYNHWSPLQAVISGRSKYIETTRPELYDLENDPGELSNLVESATEERQRMREALEDLKSEFVPAAAQNLKLTERDLEHLRTLGYVAGSNPSKKINDPKATEVLPDIKEMLPLLSEFDRARHMSMEGRLDEAIAVLEKIVAATNEFPAAGLLLGECLAQSGRLDDAKAAYRSVLAKRPDFIGARFSLGKILSQQGEFEQAESEFRAFIKQNPEAEAAQFELGQTLAKMERFDEAIAAYREAVRLAPEFAAANVHLGELLVARGQPKEAAACFEQALEQDPGSFVTRINLMSLLVRLGQSDKAIAVGKKGVELEPDSFEARFNLGILLIAQRRFIDGISELREAQRLRPDDPRPTQQIRNAESLLKRAGR
jgi:arylsulfatase A-like enzyme/predicted Zn-dependent protease